MTLPLVRVAAPIREQVTEMLRNRIVSQEFGPGERLIERELCELTGVSRASIRESLRQLESEGLVVSIPQKGIVVASLTLEEALDIYDSRSVLEGLVARLFVRRASEAQREAFFAAVDELSGVTDARTMLVRKNAVYRVLNEGAASTLATQFLNSIQARVSLMRSRSFHAPGRPQRAIEEIRALAEAVRRRDEDAAAAAAEYHVAQAAEALRIVMGESSEAAET